MSDFPNLKIVLFDNGELAAAGKGGAKAEALLALPLERLLVKVIRIPSDAEGTDGEYAARILQTLTPYPDEELTVSCETLSETESGRIVLAAALPEDSAEDIADVLDAEKLSVSRIDATALGAIRMAWPQLGIDSLSSRRIVIVDERASAALFVMDGDCPVSVRSFPKTDDIRREVMLSLIEAESFAGPKELSEVVAVGEADPGQLGMFGPVRTVAVSRDDIVEGLLQRAGEEGSLNALPSSWADVLEETRFKSKMKYFAFAALLIWFAMLGVILGVPQYYDYLTGKERAVSNAHKREYRQVREKKDQVEAVRSVFNHDLGALESLRVVSSALPEGVVLSRWNFKRGDILTFTGTSENGNHQSVYDFKDALSRVDLSFVTGDEDDAQTPYFRSVVLPRGVVSRGNKAAFDVECDFKAEEVY